MSSALSTTPYVARIIGELDTSGLVPIDPMTNQAQAQDASEAAMRALLNTDMLDFYLLSSRGDGTANGVRYYNVPFGTRGVSISQNPAPTQTASVPVWIDDNVDSVQFLVERDDAGRTPLSCVPAALMFRQLFGDAEQRIDLGPTLGSIQFSPTHIEIGWRPGETSGTGTPWYRFDYQDPGISNYITMADVDPSSGAWLWFTNPATSEPEDKWWKVSHVVNHPYAPPSARVDDPLQEPPRRPLTLKP
jgi:hypothetical protein